MRKFVIGKKNVVNFNLNYDVIHTNEKTAVGTIDK